MVPFVMPLHDVSVEQHGRYSVNVRLGKDCAEQTLHLWVLHPEENLIPTVN